MNPRKLLVIVGIAAVVASLLSTTPGLVIVATVSGVIIGLTPSYCVQASFLMFIGVYVAAVFLGTIFIYYWLRYSAQRLSEK